MRIADELLALFGLALLLAGHYLLYRTEVRQGQFRLVQRATRYPALFLCLVLPLAWLHWDLLATLQEEHTIYALSATALVALALMVLYNVFFRRPAPTTALRNLQARLRALGAVMVPLFTLYYLLSEWHLIPISSSGRQHLEVLLTALLAAMLVEGSLSLVFDTSTRRGLPQVFQETARGFLYVVLGLWILKSFYNFSPASMLAGSAVVSAGLGLFLKPTLGNFVSGLSLRLAQPYSLGHFIEVKNIMGKVHSIDWRSTALLSINQDVLTLPNSYLAKQVIRNYSLPTEMHACYLDFKIRLDASPARVRDTLLAALAEMEDVARSPAAEVYLLEFGEWWLTYRIRYWIPDIHLRPWAESNVQERLAYVLRRHDLEPARPKRTWIPRKD